jgi:hypothetical protein
MRLHRRVVGIGDFVNGKFVVPQNPVLDAQGIGDFVPGAFAVPQNPVRDAMGLGDCGCGCGNCGHGMGQLSTIDWSLTGDGVTSELGLTGVPNWLLYMGVIGVAGLVYSQKKGKRR